MENTIINGNCLLELKNLPDNSINQIITSPPYFNLRNYDVGPNALGNETGPLEYIENLVSILTEAHRVLRPDGNLILNIGDRYYGNNGFHRSNIDAHKRKTHGHFARVPLLRETGNFCRFKQLMLLPQRVAIRLQENWILRNNFKWEKPNAVPNYSKDRSRPISEDIFLLVKSAKYYCNTKVKDQILSTEKISVPIRGFGDHQASFPEELVERFILSFSRPGDMVMDPFCGSGTVPVVAKKNGRRFLGIDLSKKYCQYSQERIQGCLNH
jgi:site-specific DNA-methyltransferase (adenine-specific)